MRFGGDNRRQFIGIDIAAADHRHGGFAGGRDVPTQQRRHANRRAAFGDNQH